MKVLRYLSVLLVLIMLVGSATPAFAQSYLFQVTDQAVVVTINVDGSINIDYTSTFTNDPGAHEIDIVDIGLPNTNYELKNIAADINGVAVRKITNSDVVYPGISVYLQANSIPAGGSGTVHVYIQNVKDVLYPATQTESEEYASLVFMPNYYGSSYVHGTTNYQMTILLPPGVKETEGRYFNPQNWPGSATPESKLMNDGRIFYTWVSDQANLYTEYTFGASFPARLLNAGAVVKEPYVPPPSTPPTSSGSKIDLSFLCPVLFCLGFAGFFALMIYSGIKGAEKRKLNYLPPKILIEGNGIKRGLTAVEAAILMEQPMDKILTMILFSVLKKDAAEVVTKEPLTLKVVDPLPADLYGYETDFLAAYKLKGVEQQKALQAGMVNLIKSVTEKMKGFSRKETLAYYQEIMNKAWAQVEAAGTPEVKAQVYEDVMDWTMLDKKFEDRTQQTFSGPVFIPMPTWWWRYDPSVSRPTTSMPGTTTVSTGVPSIPSARPSIPMPTMPGSSFAASVVNSVSSFSSNLLGGLTGFSGGISKLTNPPPPPSTYRSSGGGGFSGGGHSCACACACAGCACACAGGGR